LQGLFNGKLTEHDIALLVSEATKTGVEMVGQQRDESYSPRANRDDSGGIGSDGTTSSIWETTELTGGVSSKQTTYLRDERRLQGPDFCEDLKDLHDGTKCSFGKEFGEACKIIEDCYTGNCTSKLCDCQKESDDCWGCTRKEAVCIRVEQSSPFQDMTICELSATYADNTNRPYKMFSSGGSYTENWENLRFMNQAGSNLCTTFTPYVAPDVKLPPAFAQANVDTADPDLVGLIHIDSEVYLESLIDAQVFLNEFWVKTLDLGDQAANGQKAIDVMYWPRVAVDSLAELVGSGLPPENGKTYVVEISGADSGNNTLDFEWPYDLAGIEFLGIDEEKATLYIEGNLGLQGRVSFKNLNVDFWGGTLDVQGSLIFQSCNLYGLDRCPQRYEEVGGTCYFIVPISEQAANAAEICTDASALGYHPTYEEITPDPDTVAEAMLKGEEEVWISPYTAETMLVSATCTRLDSLGSEQIYSNTTCDEYQSVLCAVAAKEAIIGRNYTSYFSDQLWPDWYQASARLVDPGRLPIQTGATLTISQEDFRDALGDPEFFEVTDELPTWVSVNVHVKYGNASTLSVAIDTLGPASTLGENKHEWPFTSTDKLPGRLQVHNPEDAAVCISQVDVLLRNETVSPPYSYIENISLQF
jgi:hypothetical protein